MTPYLVLLASVVVLLGLGALWERHLEKRVPGEYTDAGEEGL